MENIKSQATQMIIGVEKGLLGVIAVLTIVGTIQEVITIYHNGTVKLADLLLLFI